MTVIRSLTIISILLLILVTGCTTPQVSPQISPQVGEKAPDFALTSLDEQKISLSAFKGKPVLLNFWASWCPPCRYQKPHLQAIFAKETAVAVLTINIRESQQTVSDFMKRNGYTFPVLLDRDGKVSRSYQIRAIPTTFLVDKNGTIKAVKFGAFRNKAEIEVFLSQ